MNKEEFIYSLIPGLEKNLETSREELSSAAFAVFARDYKHLPENVLRELWEIKKHES